eukprot:3527249-Rhodomonas_salina.1
MTAAAAWMAMLTAGTLAAALPYQSQISHLKLAMRGHSALLSNGMHLRGGSQSNLPAVPATTVPPPSTLLSDPAVAAGAENSRWFAAKEELLVQGKVEADDPRSSAMLDNVQEIRKVDIKTTEMQQVATEKTGAD